MMDLLPPAGWGDIPTSRDLDGFRSEMKAEFSAVRAEMHSMRAEMHSTSAELLMKLFFGMVASNATLVGLVFAAVRLG